MSDWVRFENVDNVIIKEIIKAYWTGWKSIDMSLIDTGNWKLDVSQSIAPPNIMEVEFELFIYSSNDWLLALHFMLDDNHVLIEFNLLDENWQKIIKKGLGI